MPRPLQKELLQLREENTKMRKCLRKIAKIAEPPDIKMTQSEKLDLIGDMISDLFKGRNQ